MVIPVVPNVPILKPETSSASQVEQTNTSGQEQIGSISPLETQPLPPQTPSPVTPTPVASPPTPVPNVVNKSKRKKPLKSIASTTTDKLTTIADLEEEEFITKVETAHERN